MYSVMRKPKIPKPQDTCTHATLTAQVQYDILNGFSLVALRCIECGKIIKLTIYATTKTKKEKPT